MVQSVVFQVRRRENQLFEFSSFHAVHKPTLVRNTIFSNCCWWHNLVLCSSSNWFVDCSFIIYSREVNTFEKWINPHINVHHQLHTYLGTQIRKCINLNKIPKSERYELKNMDHKAKTFKFKMPSIKCTIPKLKLKSVNEKPLKPTLIVLTTVSYISTIYISTPLRIKIYNC